MSKKKLIALAVLLVILLLSCGLYWYLMPKSYVLGENNRQEVYLNMAKNPGASAIIEGKIVPDSMYVYFSDNFLKIGISEEELNKALNNEKISGTWMSFGGATLRFTPKQDWLPNSEYKVIIPDSIISENVVLKDKTFKFNSPNFNGLVQKNEFYENPKDIKLKHATASFSFSYPLQTKDLDKAISVYSRSGKKYDFTYNLTENDRVLHVMSSPIEIKKDVDFVVIEMGKIANAYNNVKSDSLIKTEIKVPSISDFFKITNINSDIIRNEQKNNDPEQILFVNFSTAVDGSEIADNITLYEGNIKYCSDLSAKFADKSDAEQLKKLGRFSELSLVQTNAGQKSSKVHSFKYDYDRKENKCLVAHIAKGLKSVEGYAIDDAYLYFFDSSEYPREAKIAFDGSIIPLKGKKQLSLTSRGVDVMEAKIARIPASNINHLITQTAGKFSNPDFINRYSFNEDNIAEVFNKTINVNMEHPSKQVYSSLDLEDYFQNKKGIFLVNVKGKKEGGYFSSDDSRLIVITDLGIIVKDNLDNTHAVFVSSIVKEKPIDGVLVEVLGKNGLPIISAKTNAEGYVKIADFSDFRNDKQAVAYKVTFDDDVSYLPIDRYDRKLDNSRFNVDGVYESSYTPKDIVSAYGFSDRGLYRPAEEAHFAFVVRQKDLQIPQRLPMSLEVRSPSGDKLASKNVWPDSYGLIEYSYNIPANSPLGHYNVTLSQIRDDDYHYNISSIDFNVQEFTPDTMRIKLNIENAPLKGWYKQKELKALVDLQNLYGNPAAEHKVVGNYSLTPAYFSFKEYAEYNFRDPLRVDSVGIKSYYESLAMVNTDKNGKAEFKINLEDFTKGTYRLNVMVDGMELDSGRGVSASQTMLVSPNEYLVGYKTDGDLSYIYKSTNSDEAMARKINFIAVNNKLEQIGLEDMTLSLYQREYVSSLVEMPDRTYRYQMVPVEKLLSKDGFVISKQGSQYQLNIENSGEFYVVVEDDKANVVAKIDYTVVGDENTAYAADKDASLEIKLNKDEFDSGESILMQIKAPYSGYGLITIERDKVYAYKWFKSDTSSTLQEIELPEGLEGNAYINISWIRSFDSKEIFISPLSYGIVPFSINKASRMLDIELNVPQTVKPGEELLIKYRANQDAEIVLYGVNTGILQVARYQLPQPLEYFMKKKALRVVTMQIMDMILPDIRVVRYLKGVGGDMESLAELAMRLNPFARKKQKPVAFWSEIIKANGLEQTYSYQVPENFNGEIKVMAVGVSKEKMGQKELQVAVRGDFAMVPSGPFNISPGDEFLVGVSVANMMEKSKGKISTEVRLLAGQGLQVIGQDVVNLDIAYTNEGLAQFRVKALERLGSIPLVFRAVDKDDQNNASQVSYEIGVRPSSPYITDLKMGYSTANLELKNFVQPMFEQYQNQEIIVSNSPLVLTQGLLAFLDKFPHYCTEQSVSKILPAMEIFFNKPELLEGLDVYATYDDVMAKLSERQTLAGGFKAWPSSWSSVDEFDSLYVLQLLTEAKKHNFNVPQGMYNKAMQYARDVAAKNSSSLDDSNPAYAAYLLTLNGEMTSNFLLKIEEDLEKSGDKKARSSLSAAYLASSYQLLQNETKARQWLGKYEFGKNDVDNARYIYLMAKHFPDDFKNLQKSSIEALLKPLKNGNFTTISSAYSLLALNALGQNESDNNITFNGKKYEGEGFAKMPLSSEVKELEVISDKPFYYVLNEQGFLKDPAKKAVSKGLEMSREYLDKDGNRIKDAKIGDEIVVKIKLRYLNGDYINDVAIIDMIPGCLDIVQNSIIGDVDNSEVREDRALIYTSVPSSGKEVSYKAKVVAKGEFVVPASFAEALYDPMVRANTKADKINVVE